MLKTKEKRLAELIENINQNIDLLPDILAHISTVLNTYRNECEKKNNNLLVNALGSACCLLAAPRKPRDMKRACTLIEEAHFPHGIESWHHEGEKKFFEKYLK